MKISFAAPAVPSSGALVLPVLEECVLGSHGKDVDARTGGALTRAMAASRFKGKAEQTLAVLAPAGVGASRVLLVGLGKAEKVDALAAEALGGAVVQALARSGESEAGILVDSFPGIGLAAAELVARIGYGARLRAYRFDRYLTREKPEQKPSLKTIRLLVDGHGPARQAFARLDKIAEGVFLTRDLVSEPANIVYPESFADTARTLTDLGVEVEVLDEKKMRKLGMGALLGVAQGSERPPRMVVMHYRGAPDAKDKRPLAFVGKGVTFDSGGLSLKPPASMEDMKWDMAGAGAVTGLMKALAGRKAKANVVGVIGLVENLPSGSAQKPGDIVTSMSGQTIEVLNTDAEGRLVLADALWYTKETLKPSLMVDLATLTGAIIMALGHEHAGLFATDDALAEGLLAAGRATGEALWRMPLGDAYDKAINADLADMKNIAAGVGAGSIIGAQFLKRFVGDTPWAHLDIAGVAWSKKDTATVPKGATGFGVRLLDRFVADREG